MATEFTLDDVAAAIRYLDCSDTDVWLRVGMAMKKEFGDDAFDTWDEWSQGDDRYKKKECETRWKNWRGSNARGSVKIGSVMHWAFERGFRLDRPEYTPEQKQRFAKEQKERRERLAEQWAKEEADIQRWYDVVADACNRLLPSLKKTGNSPYLGKKKVYSCGAFFAPCSFVIEFKPDFAINIHVGEATKTFFSSRKDDDVFLFFKRGSILIPLNNSAGELRNFQIIFNDGKSKRFFTNGQKSGLFYFIGDMADAGLPVVYCEGFATGASLHMATGWLVVVAFDAGNLPVVADVLKRRFEGRKKIYAGDNDWETALDPKKKNMGQVKADEAANVGGGIVCLPAFSGDAKGLSDFNDLHVVEGLPAVKAQLESALNNSSTNLIFATGEKEPLSADCDGLRYFSHDDQDAPPDYGDIPLPDESFMQAEFSSSDASPATPLKVEALTLEDLLLRYALIDPDSKIWDSFSKKIIKSGAFKNIVRPKLYTEWLNHDDRRTVLLEDIQRQAAAAQKKGRGGLAEALNRYVYLNPSDTAWDKVERNVVAISHLKIAIADCFAMWVTHPDREEIPMRNLVFDPSQRTDPKTHINQFRGLMCKPLHDDQRCERIVTMLMGLCNNDVQVFRWLRRWLAYPLIKVGAKMETAVLVHSSVHGSGKSFFFDVVMRQIYGEYSRTVGQAQLEGQYNDWMSKTLYCVFEEVLSRSQRYSHTGTIKQTITGKTVRIEKKFMSGWEEANHMNTVFLSNEVLPLPVEPSDRRFLVVWPETKMYEHLQRGVDEDLRNGGAAAFYQFLLKTNMQLEGEEYPFDEHTKPPMTEAKERLIEHGLPIWEVFYNAWERGDIMHNNKVVPYCCMRIGDLFSVFEAWCSANKEHGMGAHKFSNFIGSKLKKRRDLHYEWRTWRGKATFYMIGKCPDDKTQMEWLGACVQGMDEILRVEALDSKSAA